jgi:superfamily II DNA or RNA helicase
MDRGRAAILQATIEDGSAMASSGMTRTEPHTLEDLCRHAFGNSTRRKGEQYQANGQVTIDEVYDDGVEAYVQGSGHSSYFVSVRFEATRQSRKLLVYCDCPYFGGGDFCKHIWAVIRECDEALVSPPAALTGPALAVRSDPNLIGDDFLKGVDEDVEEDNQTAAPRRLADQPRQPKPPPKPRQPDWQAQLKQIGTSVASAPVLRPPQPASGKQRQAWYCLDFELSGRNGLLAVNCFYREMKKNGQYGKPRHGFSPDLSKFNDEDSQLLALLAGSNSAASNFTASPYDPYGYANRYSYGYYGAMKYAISPPMVELLLPKLAATSRFGWSDGDFADTGELHPLAWDEGDPWRFELAVTPSQADGNWQVAGRLRRGDEIILLDRPKLLLAGGLVVFDDRVARLDVQGAFGWIKALRDKPILEVPPDQAGQLLEQLWQMPSLPPLDLPAELQWRQERPEPQPHIQFLRTQPQYPTQKLPARIHFGYEQSTIAWTDARNALIEPQQQRVVMRDRAKESELVASLAARGFTEPKYRYGGTDHDVELPAKRLAGVVADLVRAGWRVEAEGLKIRRPGEFRLSVSSGVDWFDLDGQFDFEGVTASLPQLLAAVRRGEQFVQLDDGSHGMLPEEWLAKYGRLADLGQAEGDKLRFVPSQAALLDALLAAQPEAEIDATFQQVRERLQSFQGIEAAEPPEGFTGTLRDYQRQGLGWLHFLRDFRFGGCLADDMGLGKTVQVLALLEARRTRPTERKKSRKPSLVVVPRSLVYNWIEEAKRFAPALRVLNYTGLERGGALDDLSEVDLVVTTYGTLRRDILKFKEVAFDYAILDEAQAIKNASSQAAKCCRLLVADHRLAMSGTPIENHLGELWSLFEFLNPGMLGRSTTLKALAGGKSAPADAEFRTLLAQALRPFLLRRTKEQVLKELPEKTEQTLYCELDRAQRKLYDELRDHYRLALNERIAKVGINKAKIHVLEALLRLRQAACHPGLLDKQKADEPSAKLETLLEQLGEVLSEGHKALVFSQFTSLLALVRRQLDQRGIVYEYLDGKTRNRQEKVERFQTDPDCPLFLISLKAGGQGLNLTAADYVFILDPWWNPAVEAQAVDRAHRIGQNRRVFAYRLIARDTVEEKILELQGNKRQLAEAIISADNNLISALSADDLRLLLS